MAGGIDDLLAKYEAPPPPAGGTPAAVGGGGIDDVLARYGGPPAPADAIAAPSSAAAPAPSGTTAALRGLKQGLTLGFGDEIQGALAAAFSDKTYAQARDEARAADKAAKEAHPWLYGGGNLVGGAATALIPGLNIAKGATLAATAGKAALAGGIAGLGESEADLTKGEVGRAALDTAGGAAIGGALGAVGHGIGRVIGGAPARAEEAELAGLKGTDSGIQTSTRIKLFGKAGRNEPAIKAVLKSDPAVRTAIERDPGAALGMIDSKLDRINSRLDKIYDTAQVAGQGVPVSDVTTAMRGVEAEYRKTSATKPLADAVKGAIANFEEQWSGKTIPFQDLRAEVGAFAKQGFEGGGMFSIPVGKQLKRDIAGAMRDVLQEHVEKVAPATGTARKILQAANAEYSTWSGIRDAVEQKATRQVSGSPTMGQMLDAISHTGIKGAVKGVAKAGARAADVNVLAPIVRNVPRVVSSPIGAGFRALQQGTAAAAPSAPEAAAAGLRAALLPSDDEEAVAAQ